MNFALEWRRKGDVYLLKYLHMSKIFQSSFTISRRELKLILQEQTISGSE